MATRRRRSSSRVEDSSSPRVRRASRSALARRTCLPPKLRPHLPPQPRLGLRRTLAGPKGRAAPRWFECLPLLERPHDRRALRRDRLGALRGGEMLPGHASRQLERRRPLRGHARRARHAHGNPILLRCLRRTLFSRRSRPQQRLHRPHRAPAHRLQAGGLVLRGDDSDNHASHRPRDLAREHGLPQQRQLPQSPPDPRPLAHGARADAQALAAPVPQAAKAQRFEATPTQQRRGQRPEHRPRLRALCHELPQPTIGIAPAQEDKRRDRRPARRGGGAVSGARPYPASNGPCTHVAGRDPRDLGVTLQRLDENTTKVKREPPRIPPTRRTSNALHED
jgi:hypothetical protein